MPLLGELSALLDCLVPRLLRGDGFGFGFVGFGLGLGFCNNCNCPDSFLDRTLALFVWIGSSTAECDTAFALADGLRCLDETLGGIAPPLIFVEGRELRPEMLLARPSVPPPESASRFRRFRRGPAFELDWSIAGTLVW